MLIKISSARCIGIEAIPVTVEVNISNGIGIHLVGLADVAVKESLLRTITALQTLGFKIPGKKIVINLAPADIHKKGSGYDVPIALGILAASEQFDMPGLGKFLIMGELGLDGTVREIPGALPIVELAENSPLEGCILPYESALETVELKKGRTFGVHNLPEVLKIVSESEGYEDLLVSRRPGKWVAMPETDDCYGGIMDFADIVGQDTAKRGLEIAAAGSHNAILVGPPGSGKSSLAKAMCRILPPMTVEEALQTSKIYSVAGKGGAANGLIHTRPFRSPHNSMSVASLIGGGSDSISPGEISLAHNGVLFLDEFCEIPRRTIEVLRAPMEEKKMVISRLRTKVTFPADFMLVAATNPCPCGYYGEGDRCTCSPGARSAYLSKLSGPLMDRIDIQLWCKSVRTSELVRRKRQEDSATVAARVVAARNIQMARFRQDGIFCNSQMNGALLDKYCPLDEECRVFLEKAGDRAELSARAMSRTIKIARTIADLEAAGGEPGPLKVAHLAEALSFRFLDKTVK